MRTLAPFFVVLAVAILLATLLLFTGCNAGQNAFDFDASSEGAALAPLSGDDAGDDEDAPTDPAWEAGFSAPANDASVLPSGEGGPSSPASPAFDGGPAGACAAPPGPGDLVIDELMIESEEGSGDYGEWLEVTSTLPCAVNLFGLRGEAPVGAKVYSFDVTDDVWIPAGGIFLIADSADPAVNHDLPGTVLTWSGQPGDVLRNEGGTVTLLSGSAMVDSLTWPKLKLLPGTSVAFPADCPLSSRQDFSSWQDSTASWFPGFFGTPSAPNDDVECQ